ncbi:MAG: CAP domain-containing protein [Peptococcaceae bacterium]|nr:CAP domain-containing protein [Peptococcaceae bacterium]
MNRKINFLISGIVIILGLMFGSGYALAASNEEIAAAYLVDRGIYEPDAKGNLNLDQTLTRAELAMYLTRMDFTNPPFSLDDWHRWGETRFRDPTRRYHPFTDLPNWALPYVEYCYEMGYMGGISVELFDPQGLVSPKTACVVLLRYSRVPKNEISFDTSVDKARDVGLIPGTGMEGETVTRGEAAEAMVRVLAYYAETHPRTVSAPLSTPEPTPLPEPTPTPVLKETYTQEELEAMALEAVRLTNIEREKAGLPALRMMSELVTSSMAKARDMKENHYYGHVSPVYGNILQMVQTFGIPCSVAGENISVMDISAADAVAGWMASEGHRENILDKDYTHIGVGLVRGKHGFAWVQQFIQSK